MNDFHIGDLLFPGVSNTTVADKSIEPVFVIGSYRSGTSILTWALGQHSNIFSLEETNWIYRLGVYMDRLYQMGSVNGMHSNLSSMGVNRLGFYASMGEFIDSFIQRNQLNYFKSGLKLHLKSKGLPYAHIDKLNRLEDLESYIAVNSSFAVFRSIHDPKNRWVDGTPENSHFTYCLNLFFPKSKFIFLLRNPIKVAHSLMNFATVEGSAENYEEENAYNQWYVLTQSCYYALKAFGPSKVLLLHHEDLVSDKQGTIEKCLSFVKEEFDSNCLKPLEVTINSSQFDKTKINYSIEDGINSEKEYVRKACSFYKEILSDSESILNGSLEYYRLLRNRYLDHAKHFY